MSRHRNFVNFKRKLKRSDYTLVPVDPKRAKDCRDAPMNKVRLLLGKRVYSPKGFQKRMQRLFFDMGKEIGPKMSNWASLMGIIMQEASAQLAQNLLPCLQIGGFPNFTMDIIQPKKHEEERHNCVKEVEFPQLQERSEEARVQDNELPQVHEHLRPIGSEPEEVAGVHGLLLANR